MAFAETVSTPDGTVKILSGTKQEVVSACAAAKLHPVSLTHDGTDYVLLATNLKR